MLRLVGNRVSIWAGLTLLSIGCGGVVSESEPDTKPNAWPSCELYAWPVRRSRCVSDTVEDPKSPFAPGNKPYKESKLQFSW